MLIACINVYNSIDFLPKTIASIAGCVDRIIAVDGAYYDFPYHPKKPYSTDGTIEYLKTIPNCQVITRKDQPWKDQIQKRNTYFIGQKGDIYFKIDADELLILEEDYDGVGVIFKQTINKMNADVGWLTIMNPLYRDRKTGKYIHYLEPRFFRHINGIHYAGRHHWVYDGEKCLIASDRRRGESYRHTIISVFLFNSRSLHTENYVKQIYKARRNIKEFSFSDENAVYGKETKEILNPKSAPRI